MRLQDFTSPALAGVLPLLAALGTSPSAHAQSDVAVIPGNVLRYGAASGDVGALGARTNVLGFPVQGATIQLQLRNVEPGASASFFVALDDAVADIPGVGRALVDLSAPLTINATADANGVAVAPLAIPASFPAGAELYIQAVGASAAGIELSSAVRVEVGNLASVVSAHSHLDGELYPSSASAPVGASGQVNADFYVDEDGNEVGDFAVTLAAGSFQVGSATIDGLRIASMGMDSTLAWTAADAWSTASAPASAFYVYFESGGSEYGPLEVAGQLVSSPGQTVVVLDPLPAADAGPLANEVLVGIFDEFDMADDYPAQLEGMPLPIEGRDPGTILESEVSNMFDVAAAAIAAHLAGFGNDGPSSVDNLAMFDPTAPGYGDFLDAEAECLLALTDGQASTNEEVFMMIEAGAISYGDGVMSIIVSKLLAAAGIDTLFIDGFKKVFQEECAELIDLLRLQINQGHYSDAAYTAGNMLGRLTGPRFRSKLIKEIGEAAATKIIIKIGTQSVPFLGWAWFIGCLLWAIGEQLFE